MDTRRTTVGDDPFRGHFDPMLGQSDRTSAGCLWVLVGGLGLLCLIPFVAFAWSAIAAATGDVLVPPVLMAQLGWTMILALQVPIGVRSYFSRGATGRWGEETTRLRRRLPHHEGRIRGPITLLPGIRPTLTRQAVLFPSPLRTVILSHGWRSGVQVFALGAMSACAAAGGLSMLTEIYFWMIPMASFLNARRIVAQELLLADVTSVRREGKQLFVDVEGGPLHPGIVFTATDEAAAIAAEAAFAAAPGAPDTDPALLRLEDRHAEEPA